MKYELNKIYNEDCYKAIKNIPDKSINCIYTDIPYLIISGSAGSSSLSKRIYKTQKKDLANIHDGIQLELLDDFVRVMKKINIFIWCSKLQINEILNYFINLKYKNGKTRDINYEILVWCKNNPTPATNNVWLPDVEYCLYFRESGIKLNDGYELKSKWYSSPINKKDKDKFNHPTIKPLDLVERHLLHATQPNDIVLDTFIGSGTTAVAAKNTGRNYIGFEIDPTWHKVAADRLNNIDANGQYNLFTI